MAGKVFGAAEYPLVLQSCRKQQLKALAASAVSQARTLITGLAGLLLTSQTGPSTQFKPGSGFFCAGHRPWLGFGLVGSRCPASPGSAVAAANWRHRSVAHAFFHIGAEQQWPLGPVLQLLAAQRQISR